MAWKPPAEDRIGPKGWAPPASDRIDTAKPVVVVPLSDTELAPRNLAGPRKIYSAFAPGAKSRYDTDEAKASAYAQSLAAQGIEPSWAVQQFPRAASVVRSGAPGLSGLARLLYAGAKDLSSEPGRAISSRVQQGINTLRGTPSAGKTISFGMADPTGAAIGQNNFVTGIARDPFLLPSMALTGGKALAPRIAGGLAVGLGAPMLERAADYDASTTWAPTTMELATQGAMAIMPEGIGALGAALATPARTTAKRMFISQVKPPPALKKRQLWNAVDEFANSPQNLREVIGKRTSYPELLEGWEAGNAARQARVEPIYDEMERRGVMIPVTRATEGSVAALSEMKPGQAHVGEMLAAQNDLERLATQPRAQYFPHMAADLPGPVPQTVAFTPREARSFKSNAYGRVKNWEDPMSDIQSTAYEGAGRGLRQALEEADQSGTLAARNREWGDWLGVEEAFQRMRNRTTNNNPAKWYQFIKKNRENPQLVIKMLDAERGLRGAGETALQVSPFTRSLIMQHAEDGDYE